MNLGNNPRVLGMEDSYVSSVEYGWRLGREEGVRSIWDGVLLFLCYENTVEGRTTVI
jgi:hypothetical protein